MIFFIIIKHNSLRIKKKNFQKVGNKQLWQHLIYTLKGEKVFVDTDSKIILNKCKKYFPWVKLARDKNLFNLKNQKCKSNFGMIRNFLIKYSKNDNDCIVTTHVTSPFLKIKQLKMQPRN